MRISKFILIFIIIWAALVGCSVLVLNHSHGNTIKDNTTPKIDPNTQLQVLGKNNKMKENIPVTDTLK